MQDRALRQRVKGWSAFSFAILALSLLLIFQGDLSVEMEGKEIGLGTVLWLPGLIGSCAGLWLLLTLSGARASRSLPISLLALAGAEACALVLPVEGISGLYWEKGNGLVPAISFASLAITALTWTATWMVDPLRRHWWTYGVTLAAISSIGIALSYQYFYFLQGAMATALAGAVVWGFAYDGRLHRYADRGNGSRGAPAAVFLATFLALPMLLLGLPYLLQ